MLPVEAIMIGVKREMVQEEETEPMTLRRRSMTANRVVLIRDPNDEDDVKGCCGVVEKF